MLGFVLLKSAPRGGAVGACCFAYRDSFPKSRARFRIERSSRCREHRSSSGDDFDQLYLFRADHCHTLIRITGNITSWGGPHSKASGQQPALMEHLECTYSDPGPVPQPAVHTSSSSGGFPSALVRRQPVVFCDLPAGGDGRESGQSPLRRWPLLIAQRRSCATIFGHLTKDGHSNVQFTSNMVTNWLTGRAADAPGIGHQGVLF